MTDAQHASIPTLAASPVAARFRRVSLAAAFGAVSLTTLQILMLSTRVYAYPTLATLGSSAAIAALLTPIFYFALIGLAAAPDRAAGRSRAVVLGLGYLMATIAVVDFDASLDRSKPREMSFAVVAHQPHEDDGDRAFINVFDRMRPTTTLAALASGPLPMPFTLNAIDELLVAPGKSRIAVPMRAGLFGIPWFPAADYRLEDPQGA
jgi:hypothetical protein